MFSYKLVSHNLINRAVRNVNKIQIASVYNRDRIGNREWVGFGVNGQAHYVDREDYPFPAIRFRENTNELIALREKEKGDWRKLTCEEKKCLYRASFCQTFSEMQAPTGEWKSILGFTLLGLSAGLWLFMAMRFFVPRSIPETLCEDSRRAQLRRMLDLRVNPITGISSRWDYEHDDWKRNVQQSDEDRSREEDVDDGEGGLHFERPHHARLIEES